MNAGAHPQAVMGGEANNLPALFAFMSKSSATCDPSEDDWKAGSDHRTMMEAAEIRGDKSRMRGVKKHHQKQKAALGKVGRSLSGKR